MNTQHFLENGNQKFPLSTAALDFIQEQIKLVYKLTDLAGANVIIKNSTASVPGLVIFNGELLPLQGTPTTYIRIIETTEHLSVEGFDGNVRTTRIAVYSPSVMGGTCKPANQFTVLKNISTLMAEFEEAKKHHLPKGSIIDWYGTINPETLAYGYLPCGSLKYNTLALAQAAKSKWETRYPGIVVTQWYEGGAYYYVKITNYQGTVIPNLTDRFIVQAGHSYNLGDTGGSNRVTLSASQSGLPDNVVDGISKTTVREHTGVHTQGMFDYVGSMSHTTKNAHSASEAHENRPPYFALYKLIKVI